MRVDLCVRALTHNDLSAVIELDELSGNNMQQWIEELELGEVSDREYGLFDNSTGNLIGYCSVGYADDCHPLIDEHPLHTSCSQLLGDVYIRKEYRHQGLGLLLCQSAIEQRMQDYPGEAVFLTVLYDKLGEFYEKLGFVFIDQDIGYAMVRA